MKPSNNGRSVGSRAFGILALVAILVGCTVQAKGTGPVGPTGATGPAGPQGVPGVPCAGCVDSTSIAAGAISSAKIASGTISGANIDPTTSLTVNSVTSSDFVFSSPVAGAYIALPTTCHRGGGGGAPLVDASAIDYPGNVYAPSLGTTNTAAGNYDFFCAIPLPIPPGATLTLTGATMGYYDRSTNCLVSAELRTKTFGTSDTFTAGSTGVSIATVYDGANATDFAFMSATDSPQTKAFPAFTPVAISNSTILFVRAAINFTAAGGGDCRYSGTRITYTIDRP